MVTDEESEQIIEGMIAVLISPLISLNNKRTVAESLESAFHFLAINLSK